MLKIKTVPVLVRHHLSGKVPKISVSKYNEIYIKIGDNVFRCFINNVNSTSVVNIYNTKEVKDGSYEAITSFNAIVEAYKAICAYLTYTYSTAHHWSNYRLNREYLDNGLRLINSENTDSVVLGYQILKGLGINKKNANNILKTLNNLRDFEVIHSL